MNSFFMPEPLHHLHKRKRIHKKKEPYPHPRLLQRSIDHLIYGIGVLAPIMASFQAVKIWSEQTADGVSLVTFAFNMIANVFWFVYGMVHKEKPIILMYTLFFIVNCVIVAGIVTFQ